VKFGWYFYPPGQLPDWVPVCFEEVYRGKEKVATCEFTAPVQVLFNAGKVSEGVNIKKEVNSDLLSCLAPLTVESCNFFYERLV
jgi:hypothetical protein